MFEKKSVARRIYVLRKQAIDWIELASDRVK
jgi:hypothetical protein